MLLNNQMIKSKQFLNYFCVKKTWQAQASALVALIPPELCYSKHILSG